MILTYKASAIARTEREHGKNFFKTIENLGGETSMDDLLFLCQAGGATEEEFDEAVSNGAEGLLLAVMEGVNEAGFLGKKVPKAQLKKAFEEGLTQATAQAQEALQTKASQPSGATAKK